MNLVYLAGNFALEQLMAFDSSRAAVDDVSKSTKSTRAAEMEQLLGGVQMEQEDWTRWENWLEKRIFFPILQALSLFL